MSKLSIVIPVYNEERTLSKILAAIDQVQLPGGMEKEVVIVDDASTDSTRTILASLPSHQYKIHLQPNNQGKGSAIRQGMALSTGDYIIVQDADLEYDPEEYVLLLAPLLKGRADVVFGSRFMGGNPHRILFFWHSIGNKILTFISNVFTDLNLTDMETCYKMFTKEALGNILPKLSANRFNIEPDITAQVAKAKLRLYEVGISYYGRTYAEGKKINWKDGVSAIWSIIKFNVLA